jgi:hypothetical protein
MIRFKNKILFLSAALCYFTCQAQEIPSIEEKIPFACTFSKDSDPDWGDDDFVQTFFFVIPETWKKPVYIRVFDPEIGGQHDENHHDFNSKTKFTIYGGAKAHSEPDARSPEPKGKFKSGIQMSSRTFGNDAKFDNKWISFGPFNPAEGELQPDMGGRVLKLVIEGLEGDDGNLYRLFISSSGDENKSVEGANGFAYEYTFRLSDSKGAVSHLYPFVPPNVTAVKIKIFDYDNEGMVRVVSVAKRGDVCQLAGEAQQWMESRHRVSKEEINTSLDVQFIKQKDVKNNNIVVFISNQYGETMPFYTTPIGGVPKFAFKIRTEAIDDK